MKALKRWASLTVRAGPRNLDLIVVLEIDTSSALPFEKLVQPRTTPWTWGPCGMVVVGEDVQNSMPKELVIGISLGDNSSTLSVPAGLLPRVLRVLSIK